MKTFEKQQETEYNKLMEKAGTIYNRVWSNSNKFVCVTSVKAYNKGIDIALNRQNRIEIESIDYGGRIIGYGIIENPYTNEPIPDKKLRL